MPTFFFRRRASCGYVQTISHALQEDVTRRLWHHCRLSDVEVSSWRPWWWNESMRHLWNMQQHSRETHSYVKYHCVYNVFGYVQHEMIAICPGNVQWPLTEDNLSSQCCRQCLWVHLINLALISISLLLVCSLLLPQWSNIIDKTKIASSHARLCTVMFITHLHQIISKFSIHVE